MSMQRIVWPQVGMWIMLYGMTVFWNNRHGPAWGLESENGNASIKAIYNSYFCRLAVIWIYMLSLFPWLYWWGRNIFLLAVIDLLDIAPIGSLIGGRINCWKEKEWSVVSCYSRHVVRCPGFHCRADRIRIFQLRLGVLSKDIFRAPWFHCWWRFLH